MKTLASVTFFLTCGMLFLGCDQKNGSTELSAYPKNGQCAIDMPVKNAEISASEDFPIGGWAFNKTNNTVPDGLTIYFKNIETNELINLSAQTGYKRPDVASALNIPSIEGSGFNAIMEKGKLAPGVYDIVLIQVSRDSGAIICDSEPHHVKVN